MAETRLKNKEWTKKKEEEKKTLKLKLTYIYYI